MDFHVCDYLGGIGDHLCFNDALPIQQGGHSSGVIRFFDNTYTQVGPDFGARNGLIGPDIHELNTPAGWEGRCFLQDVYQTVGADLRAYGGPEDGYVLSGCLQDVDIETGNVTFQWCSLDHIPLAETYVGLTSNAIAGAGTSSRPWDYIHLNSLDKDQNGDFLFSGRHTSTIYKIAGPSSPNPGSIIWRLGGKNNSFHNQDDFKFSMQHTARWVGTDGSVTTLSFLDNASDGSPSRTTAKVSSGMVVALDTTAMIATLTEQYVQPDHKIARNQGSFQLLPNGNRFIGWGAISDVSEYALDGELLYHAKLSAGQSFRGWKFPFVGMPAKLPDILAYSQGCTAPLTIYVSWNGATEVRTWVFYSGDAPTGPFTKLGTFPKNGFETNVTVYPTRFAPYVYAEALDKHGTVLRKSNVVETFVPISTLAPSCNELQCHVGTNYTQLDSMAADCRSSSNHTQF
jgi:hypothetical protein